MSASSTGRALVSMVTDALSAQGRACPDLLVIHDTGDHVILASSSSDLVVRVHAAEDSTADVDLLLDRIGRLREQGARLLGPIDGHAVALSDGRPVSLWPRATPAVATTAQFAHLVRSLHETTEPDLPTWDLLPEVVERCSAPGADAVADITIMATLRSWVHELAATRPAFDRPVPIHTDAHSGNIMSVAGDLVLIDVDWIAVGPREFDLATRIVDNARETVPHADTDDLANHYGASIIDLDVLRWCKDLREANVVSWLITDGRGTPDAAQHLDRWLGTFRPDSGWWRHTPA